MGTVLVDGFAAGLWKITRSDGAAALRIEPWGRQSKGDTNAVMAEGARLLTFVAADSGAHDVRIF
jgi:DNA glycosylase AlkZ-like